MPTPIPFLPDLKVASISFGILSNNFWVIANIVNAGLQKTPKINPGVYVNALNLTPTPGKNEIRVQNNHKLPALPPGTSCTIASLFDRRILRRENVTHFEISADPKNLVKERNEQNNMAIVRAF